MSNTHHHQPSIFFRSLFLLSVFEFVSNLILLYAVLSICKGQSISSNFLPDHRIAIVVVIVLLLLYVALFSWIEKILDPASVLYIYETPIGWAVVAIRSALTIYAVICIIQTYRLEKETPKRRFYLVWSFFCVCWLASLPIIVGIAHELESWKRQRIVFGLTNCVHCAMYVVLTVLFRPFASNRYLDIIKQDDDVVVLGSNSQQIFPSNGKKGTASSPKSGTDRSEADIVDATPMQIEFANIANI